MPTIGQMIKYGVNFMSITTYRANVLCHKYLCRVFGIMRQGHRLIGESR